MIRLLRLIIATFIITLLINGCSYQFEIICNGLNSVTPTFSFTKPLMASPKWRKDVVPLNAFIVVTKNVGKWDYKKPMWAFELKTGSAIEVKEIKYGIVPKGFTESVKANQLSPGEPYLVIGSGPGSYGSKEFVINLE